MLETVADWLLESAVAVGVPVAVGVALGVIVAVGCRRGRCRCSRSRRWCRLRPAANISKKHDRIVKPARRQPDRCRNIDSTVTVKISQGPKNGRVADAVALVRAQAAVRIYDKDRHIIRCVVKYDEIRRSVAVHVTRFQVVADPQIFQHT